MADEQTQGRGRLDRDWRPPSGSLAAGLGGLPARGGAVAPRLATACHRLDRHARGGHVAAGAHGRSTGVEVAQRHHRRAPRTHAQGGVACSVRAAWPASTSSTSSWASASTWIGRPADYPPDLADTHVEPVGGLGSSTYRSRCAAGGLAGAAGSVVRGPVGRALRRTALGGCPDHHRRRVWRWRPARVASRARASASIGRPGPCWCVRVLVNRWRPSRSAMWCAVRCRTRPDACNG